MQSFDIVNIRVMLAVARLGSIGAAARDEHIAASAVSRRISDLEHDLGITLFRRTPAGATLTPAGKVFAGHCENLLAQFADIRADLKRFAEGEAGELRVAGVTSVMNSTLPQKIADFRAAHPGIEVTLKEIFSTDGVRHLREDLADLVVIADTQDTHGFDVVPYAKDPVWVFGAVDHPLFAGRRAEKPIGFSETIDYEHLSLHEGGALDELVAAAARKAGRTLHRPIRLMRHDSLRSCAAAGLGLGFSRRSMIQAHLGSALRAAPLADSWADRQVVCVFPKGNNVSPVVAKFLATVD